MPARPSLPRLLRRALAGDLSDLLQPLPPLFPAAVPVGDERLDQADHELLIARRDVHELCAGFFNRDEKSSHCYLARSRHLECLSDLNEFLHVIFPQLLPDFIKP